MLLFPQTKYAQRINLVEYFSTNEQHLLIARNTNMDFFLTDESNSKSDTLKIKHPLRFCGFQLVSRCRE